MLVKDTLFRVGIFIHRFVIFILFVALVVFLLLLLPPVQQSLFKLAKPLYENVLQGKMHIGSIRTNLVTSAVLSNIEIVDTLHPENNILIDDVRISFWSPALIFKKIVIHSVDIDIARVNLQEKKDQPFVFPGSIRIDTTHNKSRALWNISIDHVSVRKLDVSYKSIPKEIFFSMQNSIVYVKFFKIDSLAATMSCKDLFAVVHGVDEHSGSLHVQCTITSKYALVDSISLKSSGLALQVKGAVPFTFEGLWNLNGMVMAKTGEIKKWKLLSFLDNRDEMTAAMTMRGTLSKPLLKIELLSRQLKMGTVMVDSLQVKSNFENDTLFSSAQIKADHFIGSAAIRWKIADLFVNPKPGPYTTVFSLMGRFVPNVKRMIPQSREIQVDKINVSGYLMGNGIGFPDDCKIHASAVVDNKVTALGDIFFQNGNWNIFTDLGGNKISGKGTLSKERYISGKGNVTFTHPEQLSEMLIDQSITGNFQADIELTGYLNSLRINSRIDAKEIAWKDLSLVKLYGKVSYFKNVITIDTLNASLAGTFDSLLNILHIDSCGGNGKINLTMSGVLPQFSAIANVKGKNIFYKKIYATEVNGQLKFNSIDTILWKDVLIKNAQSAIMANGKVIRNDRVVAIRSDSKLKIGTADWKDAGDLAVDLTILKNKIKGSVDILKADIGLVDAWIPQKQQFSGKLNANAIVSGEINNPVVESTLDVINPVYQNVGVNEIAGSLALKDSVITFGNTIKLNDTIGQIQVVGTIPLCPGKGWSIDTSGKKERIVSIVSDTFNLDKVKTDTTVSIRASGLIAIDLKMRGKYAPWDLDGGIRIWGGKIDYEPLDMVVNGIYGSTKISGNSENPDVAFDFGTGNVNIKSIPVSNMLLRGRVREKMLFLDTGAVNLQNGGAVLLQGDMPVLNYESLPNVPNLAIKYIIDKVPLKVAEVFTPGIYVKDGIVNGSGWLSMSGGKIQSEGLVSLKNGVIETDLFDQKIGPVNGDLVLLGDSVSLQNWSGVVDKGAFSLSGKSWLEKDGQIGLDLRLDGKNITLNLPEVASVQAEKIGLHMLNGQRKKYLLKGLVNFGPTRFIKDVQISDFAGHSQNNAGYIPPSSVLDQVELQLDLQFQDNLFIDMNLGNLQLEGALALSGTASKPGFTGKVDVVQGDVFYLDRKFTVNKGNVTFINPVVFNPSIYLDANSEIITFAEGSTQSLTYSIQLTVTGDLQHPIVSLSSNPPLNEPNIISLLTFGAMTGSIGSTMASRIGSLVGNEILGFGTRKLERLLNLESLTVTGDVFGTTNNNTNRPQLSVSKRLSGRLLLSYETALANINQQKLSILYRLFPFLYLSGQTDSEGNSSVNLKFRITH